MLNRRFLLVGVLLLAVAGCGGKGDKPTPQADAGKLDPLLMPKPDAAMSVRDLLAKNEEDKEYIVRGQVPPATTKPFDDKLANFILMSSEDLANKETFEKLQCPDAAD